jgi:hypothetical protein
MTGETKSNSIQNPGDRIEREPLQSRSACAVGIAQPAASFARTECRISAIHNRKKAFTIHNSPMIDRVVTDHLSFIAFELLAAIRVIRSMILVGGFGRGEGSVMISGEEIHPLNDYDIVLVTDGDPGDLRPLAKQLAGRIGIRHVDLIPLPYREICNLLPTQFNFDMKYGGYTFWGEELLPLLPSYGNREIGRESARDLLVNRFICLLECYQRSFTDQKPNEAEHYFLCQQVSKSAMALGEALLMDRAGYHFSAQTRRQLMNDLFQDQKQLVDLHSWGVNYKLQPSLYSSVNSVAYWHATVELFLSILPHFLPFGDSLPLFSNKPGSAEWIYLYLFRMGNRSSKDALEKGELALLAAVTQEEPLKTLFTRMASRQLSEAGAFTTPSVDWELLRQASVSTWHGMFD